MPLLIVMGLVALCALTLALCQRHPPSAPPPPDDGRTLFVVVNEQGEVLGTYTLTEYQALGLEQDHPHAT